MLTVSTRIQIANCLSIGSAIFAGLTIVTDRQTDRQTQIDYATPSVTTDCIYIITTAMRPKKLAYELLKDAFTSLGSEI